MKLRNIAIIAHVDHGKTTLIDVLLRQSGSFRDNQRVAERAMDSNDLERERGITILAKVTSLLWHDTRINIVDTPGHADFGGEVERILNMVDGAIVLVDASEGPMPQTKFVVSKALKVGLKPIVAINKIDKADERHVEVINEVFDLFAALDANEDQLDFPILYGSAKEGWMSLSPDRSERGHGAAVRHGAEPCRAAEDARRRLPDAGDDHRGRPVSRPPPDRPHQRRPRDAGHDHQGPVPRRQADRAGPRLEGAGLPRPRARAGRGSDRRRNHRHCRPQPGDRRRHASARRKSTIAIPAQPIDPPTLSMTFRINDGPLAGLEGDKVQSRVIRDRLMREAEGNVALKISQTADIDAFEVAGRGELQLAILIETMRREGFELTVSRPRVVMQSDPVTGQRLEPIEEVIIDVDEEYTGPVVQKLSERRADLIEMRPSGGGRQRLVFYVPTRGLIGYQTELLSDTRGTAVMNRLFHAYAPFKGEIPGRRTGVLISNGQGEAVAYALWNLEDRGPMIIHPQTKVYQGMIVGEHTRGNDLEVNVLKGKKLTNVRAAGRDDNVLLTPPMRMTLEMSLAYIQDDELVEITPKSIRLRKRYLDPNERKKAERLAAS